MLSNADYYKSVPRDPCENLEFRLWLQDKCLKQPEYRKAVIHMCETDCLFWINAYVWQFNPKPSGRFTKEIGPFITWDYQDETINSQDPQHPGLLWCIETGHDAVIEKSRDMGASWICLMVMLWMTLFKDWKKFTLISKDETAVWKAEESDSLFWKLHFIMSYLPKWLIGDVRMPKMAIKSERTNSSITGYASTGKSGIGGRATALFVDEYSLIKEDRELFANTADVTNCRIFNGTHYGTSGQFFDLCDSGSEIGQVIKKIQMHWTKHPDKGHGAYRYDPRLQAPVMLDPMRPYPADYQPVCDGTPAGGPFPGVRSPWYDKECVDRASNKRSIALHLDMDPKGSSNQFFDPIIISQLRREYAKPALARYDVMYDPDTGQPSKTPGGGSLVKTPSGRLWMWKNLDPIKNEPLKDTYAIGGDVAAGTGATPSVFSIMNSLGEKVGRYFNAHIEPTPLGPLVVALCWIFCDDEGRGARLVWEMNGPGVKLGERIIELGYRNVHYRVTTPWGLDKKISDMPGWYPNKDRKRVLLEDYRNALQNRLVLNPCDEALETCLDFVWKNGTIEHDRMAADEDESGARENHGDEVMADALTWMMIKDVATKPVEQKEKKHPPGSREWLKQYRQMHAEERERAEAW